MSALAGRVVALIGTGSESDRAIVVACSQEGADIALATTARFQAQEFAMNSIANEAWVIGREQFVTVLDALDDASVIAFAEQVWDRFGRCDALIAAHHAASSVPLDEMAPHEFEEVVRANLTAPFLAAQAFGRLMERAHGGHILFVARDVPDPDAAYATATGGLTHLAAAIERAWGATGVSASVMAFAAASAGDVVALLSRRLAPDT